MLPLSTMTVALLSKRRNRFDSRAHLHDVKRRVYADSVCELAGRRAGSGVADVWYYMGVHLYLILATTASRWVRACYVHEVTLERECVCGAPWLLPFDILPSPSRLSPSLSLSFCPFTHPTTHRHHSAIHLGPALLITRLGLRTRSGIEVPSRRSVPLKRKQGYAGGLAPRIALRVLFSSPLVFVAGQVRLSFPLSIPVTYFSVSVPLAIRLLLARARANDGFLFFCQRSATKGPFVRGRHARGYFIRRMLFNAPRGVTRVARSASPFRTAVISPRARFPLVADVA